MQLVVLAAGHGRRFGGLKQLAPVGLHGEAIMDYTAYAAENCGMTGVVLVVREDIRDEIASHVRQKWPKSLSLEYVEQPPIPGTAQAVYAAHAVVDGAFGVANADDLYGEEAIAALMHTFGAGRPTNECANDHVLIGYELGRTVLTAGAVTRGLVEVSALDRLAQIVEHTVVPMDDGCYEARPLPSNEPHEVRKLNEMAPRVLDGSELVSMNLWGFHRRLFAHLAEALESFHPETAPRPELLLPDVVGHLVATGTDRFRLVPTTSRCIGITHQGDLTALREELVRRDACA